MFNYSCHFSNLMHFKRSTRNIEIIALKKLIRFHPRIDNIDKNNDCYNFEYVTKSVQVV